LRFPFAGLKPLSHVITTHTITFARLLSLSKSFFAENVLFKELLCSKIITKLLEEDNQYQYEILES
jgi:hypothetical protein